MSNLLFSLFDYLIVRVVVRYFLKFYHQVVCNVLCGLCVLTEIYTSTTNSIFFTLYDLFLFNKGFTLKFNFTSFFLSVY